MLRNLTQLSPGALLGYAVLAVFIAISLLPLWMGFKTSILYPSDVFPSASELISSTRVTGGNFMRVVGLPTDVAFSSADSTPIDFMIAMRNSVIYTGLVVTGQLFFSAMAAYAFARIRFPGRDLMFYSFLAATMIPGVVLFIPNFLLIKQLGWLNTFQGMVAPSILMTPFAVFFLQQFFISSPTELEEAAKLEGCTPFQVFWQVALPLQRGPIATLAILLSINAWNEFFWPFLTGRDAHVRVVAVALSDFMSQTAGSSSPDWSGVMAAVTISIIPILIVLGLFGRQIVESIQTSGMK